MQASLTNPLHPHPRHTTGFYPPVPPAAYSRPSAGTRARDAHSQDLRAREIGAQTGGMRWSKPSRGSGASPPAARRSPRPTHSTATGPTKSLPRPAERRAGAGAFQNALPSALAHQAGSRVHCTTANTLREAQTLGFVHLRSTNGQVGVQQKKRGEMEQTPARSLAAPAPG